MKLTKSDKFAGIKGPLLTIVMDGVGLNAPGNGSAVEAAYTPTLDMLMKKYPMVTLKAHGTAVGLPSDDDMGNSEVGHNALGSGQVFCSRRTACFKLDFFRQNVLNRKPGKPPLKTYLTITALCTFSVFSQTEMFIPISNTYEA